MGERIRFVNPDDKQWMSSYSQSVLETIAAEAKIDRLDITSAVRTATPLLGGGRGR
jgi:hypothetical protein